MYIWIYFLVGLQNCYSLTDFNFKYLPLEIPWPSGIIIEKVNDRFGNNFRLGRLQQNAVQLRPNWYTIKMLENVLNTTDCFDIVNRTDTYVNKYGWPKGRHIDYNIRPTNDLPMNLIFPNALELKFVINKIKRKLFQSMSKVFNLPWKKFYISDLFLTQYNATLQDRSYLGPHQDKSQWSFIILLNDDFDGGGTYFFDTQELWKPTVGSALYFSGLRTHGGSPIKSGIRYILAGFCDYGNYSHESFMELYNPVYDGYAAQAGFHTNDIISALEVCSQNNYYFQNNDNSFHSNDDNIRNNQIDSHASNELNELYDIIDIYNNRSNEIEIKNSNNMLVIQKKLIIISNNITDEEWINYAQSCEKLDPGSKTITVVKRFIGNNI